MLNKIVNFKTSKKTAFYKLSKNVSGSAEYGGNTLNNVAKGKPWAGCYAQLSQYLRILKNLSKKDIVLDVGAGQCELLTVIRENFLVTKYIGLELNNHNIKKSLPLFKKPEREMLIQHDVTLGLPINDNTIDLVACGLLLEHLPRKKGFFVFEELIRVCKPNGLIYIMIPIRKDGTENVQSDHIYEWFESDVTDRIEHHKKEITLVDKYPINVHLKDIKKGFHSTYERLKDRVPAVLLRIVLAPLLTKGRDITIILRKKDKNVLQIF